MKRMSITIALTILIALWTLSSFAATDTKVVTLNVTTANQLTVSFFKDGTKIFYDNTSPVTINVDPFKSANYSTLKPADDNAKADVGLVVQSNYSSIQVSATSTGHGNFGGNCYIKMLPPEHRVVPGSSIGDGWATTGTPYAGGNWALLPTSSTPIWTADWTDLPTDTNGILIPMSFRIDGTGIPAGSTATITVTYTIVSS